MKKTIIAFAGVLFMTGSTAFAQEDKAAPENKGKKQVDEIVIRKKGDKDANLSIVIKDGKVTINGKPLEEFKDDSIKISTRKTTMLGRSFSLSYPGEYNNEYNIDGLVQIPENTLRFWNEDGAPEVKRTFLGVTTAEDDKGAKITKVNTGSAAEKAGLKEDDIIIKVGDKVIEGPLTLSEAITSFKPKEEVKITYLRAGKEMTTKAVLGEIAERGVNVFSMAGPDGYPNLLTERRMLDRNRMTMDRNRMTTIPRMKEIQKLRLKEMKDAQKQRLEMLSGLDNLGRLEGFEGDIDGLIVMGGRRPKIGLRLQDTEDSKGVKVIDVDKDTPAAKAGLKKDDIVISINGKDVNNTDEAREALNPGEDNKKLYSIKAKRNGADMTFEVKIPVKLKTASF
jgi:serine protease Do